MRVRELHIGFSNIWRTPYCSFKYLKITINREEDGSREDGGSLGTWGSNWKSKYDDFVILVGFCCFVEHNFDDVKILFSLNLASMAWAARTTWMLICASTMLESLVTISSSGDIASTSAWGGSTSGTIGRMTIMNDLSNHHHSPEGKKQKNFAPGDQDDEHD